MTLFEISSLDRGFADAIKMLIIKGHSDGVAKIPMSDLINSLSGMGFGASNQVDAIRSLISVFKTKNNDLISDVNNNEVVLTTVQNADTQDQAEKNKEKINADAEKEALASLKNM